MRLGSNDDLNLGVIKGSFYRIWDYMKLVDEAKKPVFKTDQQIKGSDLIVLSLAMDTRDCADVEEAWRHALAILPRLVH